MTFAIARRSVAGLFLLLLVAPSSAATKGVALDATIADPGGPIPCGEKVTLQVSISGTADDKGEFEQDFEVYDTDFLGANPDDLLATGTGSNLAGPRFVEEVVLECTEQRDGCFVVGSGGENSVEAYVAVGSIKSEFVVVSCNRKAIITLDPHFYSWAGEWYGKSIQPCW